MYFSIQVPFNHRIDGKYKNQVITKKKEYTRKKELSRLTLMGVIER